MTSSPLFKENKLNADASKVPKAKENELNADTSKVPKAGKENKIVKTRLLFFHHLLVGE